MGTAFKCKSIKNKCFFYAIVEKSIAGGMELERLAALPVQKLLLEKSFSVFVWDAATDQPGSCYCFLRFSRCLRDREDDRDEKHEQDFYDGSCGRGPRRKR